MTTVFRKNLKQKIKNGLLTSSDLYQALEILNDPDNKFILDPHDLEPPMQGLFSFKIFGIGTDLIVIYQETIEAFILYDIGSHKEVYQQKGRI